jgi:hypothetical protein
MLLSLSFVVMRLRDNTRACEINIGCDQMTAPTDTLFRTMDLSAATIILGLLWLRQHNPKVKRKTGTLTKSDDNCNTETLAQMLPANSDLVSSCAGNTLRYTVLPVLLPGFGVYPNCPGVFPVLRISLRCTRLS